MSNLMVIIIIYYFACQRHLYQLTLPSLLPSSLWLWDLTQSASSTLSQPLPFPFSSNELLSRLLWSSHHSLFFSLLFFSLHFIFPFHHGFLKIILEFYLFFELYEWDSYKRYYFVSGFFYSIVYL